jgi:hypothetical protein
MKKAFSACLHCLYSYEFGSKTFFWMVAMMPTHIRAVWHRAGKDQAGAACASF